MEKFKAIINNQEIESNSWLDIMDPTTDEVYAQVSALSAQEIDSAFKAAKAAQKNWEAIGIEKRIEFLTRWRDLMLKNEEDLATTMMHEIAKAYKDCLTEVRRTAEYIDLTISEYNDLQVLTFDKNSKGINEDIIAEYKRIAKGVGVGISPFNYPINLAVSKLAPGLLTGNTFVFKPATQGSIVGIKIGQLAIEAGIPAGVLNVVTGRGREIGDVIVTNPLIDFISFTGSVPVGRRLMEISSSKDLVLELGGKDAAILLDDHNLENIAKDIVAGAFSYSGQRCTAIKRVITTNDIADKLTPLIKAEVAKLTVGLPSENPIITPMIDKKSADFVTDLINDAIKKGATLVYGGSRDKNLLQPTLLDNVTVEMNVAWEEPFGPVLPIIRINEIENMINIANKSNFGLQTSVYSKDVDLAYKVAEQLEVGTVNINRRTQRGPDVLPFLGVKDSGFGVQGIKETILSTTRYRGIIIKK
ncbi:glyceraldehyde-3-phosphate dehydrogenase [Mesoplasma entomophilum]|uniref:NADP-dependent glyceraldehyde-3-phosphate dehydrogenase n=1 Tax=Mesoplasma entomophilum TaxID=2149 RepID=A0A3S5XZD8_9MOLU|nr:NADP-dependent glyceraldehyde-3-phosphate dehydrogenase [Mesoplasma entomophilum]ATQ35416.1 NADP-dependent glyceraldehyde-3-phosphate dehydrogenase [Mesoplasma entomophilum]ATZ19373.1 glyceraldehyde-3-phosphate dehydrogenase [Mesoplasma entomophilum]